MFGQVWKGLDMFAQVLNRCRCIWDRFGIGFDRVWMVLNGVQGLGEFWLCMEGFLKQDEREGAKVD